LDQNIDWLIWQFGPQKFVNSGEIYRCYNCTTFEKGLDEALGNLDRILQKIFFPSKIIKEKINEIKNRNFEPKPNKAKRLEEAKNPNLTHVTISLPYTSFRCSVVASKIHQILKKYTPNFKLRIAFSTLKLSSIILPRLKPQIDTYHNSNLVYKFTCPCSDTYIGETTRLFDTRILEHRRTNIRVHKHIIQCNAYKTALNITYGLGPTDDQQREFIRSFLEILEKNEP